MTITLTYIELKYERDQKSSWRLDVVDVLSTCNMSLEGLKLDRPDQNGDDTTLVVGP